jgi:hypothetical protein
MPCRLTGGSAISSLHFKTEAFAATSFAAISEKNDFACLKSPW